MTDKSSSPPDVYAALSATSFPWSICIVGEDQSRKLTELTHDLTQRPYSTTGDGKRISSGFLYWGVDPTMEWVRACSDPFYPVMRDGIESFKQRWRTLQQAVADEAYNYVSLGPGTGDKDRAIIEGLLERHPRLAYVPVDMSAEMLRLTSHEPIRSLGLPLGRVLPVQMDFSIAQNASALRTLLNNLIGKEPTVFSLLGNTLANFDQDKRLLQMLVQQLLLPNDLLVLEVATTQKATPDLATRASDEYRGSGTFSGFVTSALQNYTDLTIDLDSVVFSGEVEDDRALRIKVWYENRTEHDLRITFPGHVRAPFRKGDTILLDVTRKYTPAGLDDLLRAARLSIVATVPWRLPAQRDRGGDSGFGVDTLLLKSGGSGLNEVAGALWKARR